MERALSDFFGAAVRLREDVTTESTERPSRVHQRRPAGQVGAGDAQQLPPLPRHNGAPVGIVGRPASRHPDILQGVQGVPIRLEHATEAAARRYHRHQRVGQARIIVEPRLEPRMELGQTRHREANPLGVGRSEVSLVGHAVTVPIPPNLSWWLGSASASAS